MPFNVKHQTLVPLLILILIIAVACGDTTSSVEPNIGDDSSAKEPITLRVATGDSGDGLTPHREIIENFQDQYPHISIVLESVEGQDYYGRLLTKIKAEKAPDIFQIGDDALPNFVEQGALLALDPLSNRSTTFDQTIYLPSLLAPGQWQGQQYLLPKDYSPLAVYYNKQIFDEYGVPYPQEGWTWTDLLETAQQLTKDTDDDGLTDLWGIQLPATWTTGFEYWVVASGARFMDEEQASFSGYFDSPEMIEAVQFYADLYNKYQVAPLPVDLTAFGGGNQEFDQGRAAMRIFGRWPQAGLLENPNITLGVVGVPKHKQQANILFWGGFGINRNSPHQEEAWLFLQFYVGQEGAEIWQNWALPAVESVANQAGLSDDPIEGVWLSQLGDVVPRGYTYVPHWERTVDPALRRVLESAIIDPDADVDMLLKQASEEAEVARQNQ
ncbi:MAG: sugar ABC transporter substrate-binding protein [Chloroflexota bacterium]